MTSNKTIIIAVLLVTLSSCISRLEQHALYGTVVNMQKRYNQFLLSELFIMEAPPIAYNIPVKKEGYKTTYISFINPRGGGTKKGASRNLDTIYLKKKNKL